MTTITPSTTTRRRGRTTTASPSSAAARCVQRNWLAVWFVVVPLLVGFYVNQVAGDAWSAIPAPWLGGDPAAAGPNIAGLVAVVACFVLCLVMHRKHVDLPLGLLPIVGAVIASFTVGIAWYGAVAGLAVGAVVVLVRRRQGRR